MIFGALSGVMGCSPSSPEPLNVSEPSLALWKPPETNECKFSDKARATLSKLHFFSTGNDQELYWDGEMPVGSLHEGNLDIRGVRWFYAYPWCSGEDVTYNELPFLLRNSISPRSARTQINNRTTFSDELLPTDLNILSFDGYRVAFRTGKPSNAR
ncbi:hypothetical protein [Novosphingobium aerophilum]|uniref:Uncharacterized protein n=1 Tax=Novosphingobium aerophilum TaxID=2839843 RepID=A0A7X1FBH6_9SPHN|nr:hypothetical protein [Novosphingobium aerophilum]MBC2653679.1 hypothetical protein [Novosphingobium aerophilum]